MMINYWTRAHFAVAHSLQRQPKVNNWLQKWALLRRATSRPVYNKCKGMWLLCVSRTAAGNFGTQMAFCCVNQLIKPNNHYSGLVWWSNFAVGEIKLKGLHSSIDTKRGELNQFRCDCHMWKYRALSNRWKIRHVIQFKLLVVIGVQIGNNIV